jgi:hypothetical protein
MISSSNRAIMGSRDKILYEEAYQAALAGTHVARAWMIDPELAGEMTGHSTIKGEIEKLVWRGMQMNDEILFDRARDDTQFLQGTTERFTAKPAYFTLGETLDGGRQVLYDFPGDSPIVSFINDKENKRFSDNLFHGTPTKGHRHFVERIRITTPPMDASTSVSLLECTFVIESHGVAEYAGTRKERVVHQRVLIHPKRPGGALMSAGEAIITKSGMTIKAKSHANVHWAPVLAKGDITMAFLNKLTKTPNGDGTVSWNLSTLSGVGDTKYNGAGAYTADRSWNVNVMDEWLQWKTGAKIVATDGTSLFSAITPPSDVNGNPIEVGDFFAQVKEKTFSAGPNLLEADSLSLGGSFAASGTSMGTPNGVFNETPDDESGDTKYQGSLVQNDLKVNDQVDAFFATMNYAELKAYAKNHNGYYYYDGAVLYDGAGKVVTSDKYPDMGKEIPKGTILDPLLPTAVQDRILFVDSAADKNSMEPNNPFPSTMKMPDFWKGVVYINGSIYSSGTGMGESLLIRTPKQFADYREYGTSTSYQRDQVLVDGILMCNGVADLGGNASIYGTLAATGGVALGGTPSIFFNSANGEGRMKGDQSMSSDFRLIAGKLYEE